MTQSIAYKQCYLKSPLNYIGGKYKILSQILPLFARKETFIDLFCGGCNVSINIDSKTIICNDNLTYLIELYKFLQSNDINTILNDIDSIINKYNLNLENLQGYNELRKDYNVKKSPILLLVLIAYAFNHQIRFNNSHCFNTPFGRNRSSFNETMKHNLINFVRTLQNKNIQFLSLDFKNALDSLKINSHCFVYADPPYLITQGTYNDGKRGFSGWNEKLENELLDYLATLDAQNINFALSNVLIHKNQENLILKKWIKTHNFYVFIINAYYTNSNYQVKFKDKSMTQEVLITNYQP